MMEVITVMDDGRVEFVEIGEFKLKVKWHILGVDLKG
jgi:hypothetical protein